MATGRTPDLKHRPVGSPLRNVATSKTRLISTCHAAALEAFHALLDFPLRSPLYGKRRPMRARAGLETLLLRPSPCCDRSRTPARLAQVDDNLNMRQLWVCHW